MFFLAGSAGWFYSQHCSIRIGSPGSFLRGDVNIAVRTLLDIANPDTKLREQRLTPFGLRRLIESDALELLSVQRSHKQVSLPCGELVTGIENDARWADGRHPEYPWIIHTRSI